MLGFKLSVVKGAYGKKVNWAGLTIEVNENYVKATIDDAKRVKAKAKITELIGQNLIDRTELSWWVSAIVLNTFW